MSATFKNASSVISSGGTTVYTCPAATQSVIHGCFISNQHASTDHYVTIQVYDYSATVLRTLAKSIVVPFEDTFVFDGKINLEANDYLKVTIDAGSDCEAFLSILEKA